MRLFTNLKFMAMALFVAMLSMSFTACSDDDDDNGGSASSIVGVWTDDEDETTLTFRSDGTGELKTESGTSNLKYTYSYDTTSDSGTLKYWFLDSSTVYTYKVTITGNTMMWSSGTYTLIFKRKK